MDDRLHIISLPVNQISFRESLDRICAWGLERRSGFVCFANVHMIIEAHTNATFNNLLRKAALVLPDGQPLALACRWLYRKKQERISGMDFMPALLQEAHRLKARVFLYGSTETVLEQLIRKIETTYPGVQVAGAISPPFRPLSQEELNDHIDQINRSGANFVLVALGCPKQETWMALHSEKLHAVLLGLGGAFPVTAGLQKRAPVWMQRAALEWLHRLLQEPGRLFKRYLYTNLYFIVLLVKAIFRKRKYRLP
jgi:N-acetylglucosaminyldiphosphoundecaprenol N-acetyl-beta-D-mannosaminyltransferase